jgi:pimeloyl-ACP methyl ester carboxylesterase
VSTSVRCWSAGPPSALPRIVVIPGLAVCDYLRPIARLVGSWARVYVLELPGFGRAADRSAPIMGIAGLAAILQSWWSGEGMGSAVLIGHSIGTQIAAQAVADGLRPSRLIVASPTIDPAHATLARLLGGWMANAPREPASLAVRQLPEWAHAGLRRIVATLNAARRHDLALALGGATMPVTIVRGRDDRLSTATWARRLARICRCGSYIEVGGAHAFPYGNPAGCASLLVDCLRAAQ